MPVWSRQEIESRILAGETLVIRHGLVHRIPQKWLANHPGGALAILHFVGRDASEEIDAYHSDDTLRRMKNYVVAKVEEPWAPLLPPVMSGWVRRLGPRGEHWHREAEHEEGINAEHGEHDAPPFQILLVKSHGTTANAPSSTTIQPAPSSLSPEVQQQHVSAYRTLHAQIKKAGLYDTNYISGYGPEFLRYTLLVAITLIAYSKSYFIIAAISQGLLWHQLAFFAHDLGHCSVTHKWLWDRLLAIFVTDFLGGLSIGWWVDNHNIHHLVTNHPSHDPDIQHIPFFAISPVFLKGLWSSYYKRVMAFDGAASLFLKVQHRIFYVVMSMARFNLYANSYGFLAIRARRTWDWYAEVGSLIAFWSWYGTMLYGIGSWKTALVYLLISHIVTSPLHIQIVLSHFSRSTTDLGPQESFPHRQLRTTTDVICPPSLAFLHGGLHLQVTHHLFPRLPRHSLLAASKLVKVYAKEQGLEYAEFGFIQGNEEVRNVLQEVARQVGIVKMVAEVNIKEAMKAM
ncbi:fatty acid/sphingolipid desaturase [Hysterangium stoloniferum]|nr:fatty acid/sphingolipid desaturase [Hysterangium stoloniferum]